MSGGSQGLAHLCASTGVQGLFDPISTKKCLEEFSRHTEPKETSDRPSSVSLEHASVFHWNGYISKSKGRSSGSGSASWSSFSAFANGYWPFVTLTAARTAADSHCVPFSLRSIHFFLSPERPALLCSIAHKKQNARTFCHFIFHEPEGIFMSNFLSSFLIIVSTGTCFFRRAWTTG